MGPVVGGFVGESVVEMVVELGESVEEIVVELGESVGELDSGEEVDDVVVGFSVLVEESSS